MRIRPLIICTGIIIMSLGISSCTKNDEKGSVAIRDKISEELHSTDSDAMKLYNIRRLNFDLAMAYNREIKPEKAIEILQDLIKKNRNPHDPIVGMKFEMASASYGMEALYYKELAKSYSLRKDAKAQKKALSKAERAETMENKLKPIETIKYKARKQKISENNGCRTNLISCSNFIFISA